MIDQEEAFIRRFVIEEKQRRYIGFLSKSQTRGKFLSELYHRLAVRGSLAEEVRSNQRTVEKVEASFLEKGAMSDVYVISPDSDIDQRWMSLTVALRIVIDDCTEAVVCCKLGELAFYRSEDSAWIFYYDKGSLKVVPNAHLR